MESITKLRGLVASVVLTGTVLEEFSSCLMEMRAWCIENGFKNIEWKYFPAQLVEHGRNSVIQHAKNENYDYVLMLDADATFNPMLLQRMLQTGFETVPVSDVVSAYAQLKSPPFLPVIDTGTGTWEPHYPGEGVLECIRVGGHCILLKNSVWQKLNYPWFKTRVTNTPMHALADVDNYARIKFSGKNPFQGTEWSQLLNEATKEHGGVSSSVGEDSGFCDALKAAGGRIFVNCDIVTGHIHKTSTSPTKLKEELAKQESMLAAAVGVNKP